MSHSDQQFFKRKMLDDAHLGIIFREKSELFNPLAKFPDAFEDSPELYITWLMSNPEYFYFTCKYLMGVKLHPFQGAILRELWNHKFPMLIGSRGMSKSFLLAIYAILRILFVPKYKVLICSRGFRQSKLIFNYVETIIANSSILKDMVAHNGGIYKGNDGWELRLFESNIRAIPLGDGSSIRGARANSVLADEFGSIPLDVFEQVVAGFTAVSPNPTDSAALIARNKLAEHLGMTEEKVVDSNISNQIVISGTAGYSFEHFSKYHDRYVNIIKSRGNPDKLKEIFGGEAPERGFDWRDFSVIRLPVHLLPEGFMDDAQIARAKATVHSGIYAIEYEACHHPNTKIITDKGVKNIIDIDIGDLVLTHKGRFRKVINKTYRLPNSPMMKWHTFGGYEETISTSDHHFWNGNDFEPLGGMTNNTYLSTLKDLSNIEYFDITSVLDDYMECGDRIYPVHARAKFNRHQLRHIRELNNSHSQSEIGRIYGVRQSVVHNIIKKQRFPKNAIPNKIKLDFNFGLIIGYYASEGSCGADGRAVTFSLDGHCNINLDKFIIQLKTAIESVFGFNPKIYYSEHDNTANITINQVFMSKIFKYICPGISHTKLIKHDILFSNANFLKGFITGYWNGDGHWRLETKAAIAGCVNLSLLCQVRLALSYFGINSSIRQIRDEGTAILHGKTYNIKRAYGVIMNGQNLRKFKKTFYNEVVIETNKRSLIRGNKDILEFDFIYKYFCDYEGYVYNLEVEEDHSYSLLNATVHNCFSSDSNGFFPRSLIEKCVVKDGQSIYLKDGITISADDALFHPTCHGNKHYSYVIGVDPAMTSDNFAIVVIEVHKTHRRVVYCWTTNESDHNKKVKDNLTTERNYYAFCARKIRELMKEFNTLAIAIDKQGGGKAVMEALNDPKYMQQHELELWPMTTAKPQETDYHEGLHILDVINFAREDYTGQSNHGLRKDMEEKILMFPLFDAVSLAEADIDRELFGHDNEQERCIIEIEELKNELCTIVVTKTAATNRERFDTPEFKTPGGRKGRMRKDRYSALLMANMTARTILLQRDIVLEVSEGGFAGGLSKKGDNSQGKMFSGPAWLTSALSNLYD